MAARLRAPSPVVKARDLLIYRVLLRDQPAIVELVQAVLGPLFTLQAAVLGARALDWPGQPLTAAG